MITFVRASMVVFAVVAALELTAAFFAASEGNGRMTVALSVTGSIYWALATWALVLLLTQ